MTVRSARLDRLPAYTVAELAARKRRLLADGVDVIDLSAGDVDFPPPEAAVEALREAVGDPRMSRYPHQVGLLEFREAAANYMERRFGVAVDPLTEVLPLIGSKEGLSHLPLAVVNPGDVCVLPDPGYPAYIGGAVIAEADVERVPLVAEKEFLVELGDLPADRLDAVRLVYLNYPNNPTAAVAPLDYLKRTVEVCLRRGIVLAYDNPYCEITFDGYTAPSIFEIEGAREVALEFHSASKSFSMTGWRLGWVVGRPELISALTKVKTYVDTGVFLAVQKAGAAVLDRAEELVAPVRERLAERRDAAVRALDAIGLGVEKPKATMYLWVPLPKGTTSVGFTREVLEHEGVLLLPGTAFGEGGEGYFRIALTVESERVAEAVQRVGRTLERMGAAGARL
ncbi:MAG: aminotransferase class I/II-fold pyridoxal phosphate-dependent enzyme [Gemmatimonadales bacterium]|nr:aminotransferase class I/II-fold pyridoxal phosphate-dependent enzyme [Gemmatimonadales bacterium]NIN12372.1 aminotransferase class I/II-fold pyridoxal phosphate-dependent enzyme [Gemmatimonadales bacterium]NIN48910.1 aminotransferase class I/II-fold pyridoxal phosphate-dependent enzyme [Gemmatimonadales bacterium]NIP06374.1 aminotransferase class I/II-fold pyridoxal phosphate-dependent enzyme [Gemmatimonadales bacterium]NIR00747.1 aminotransferase class I/II-fold pyridoxal phosphate-depende